MSVSSRLFCLFLTFSVISYLIVNNGIAQEKKSEVIDLKNKLPLHKQWALILYPSSGDPVHMSSWYIRESCESERTFLIRIALDKGTALPGTRCVNIEKKDNWITSLFNSKGQSFSTFSRCPTLWEYFEDAVNSSRTRPRDIEEIMPLCKFDREVLMDETVVWKREVKGMIIVTNKEEIPNYKYGNLVEYTLTFNEQNILTKWKGKCEIRSPKLKTNPEDVCNPLIRFDGVDIDGEIWLSR